MFPCTRFLKVAALIGGAMVFASATSIAAPDDVGQAAPALIVKLLSGQDIDLATLRGKVVVLNIWATWCPPCRAEMPMLDAFSREHQTDGVVVIGLSADDLHDRKDVAKAMKGFAYPAALLSEARGNGFGTPKVLPITYVIGPDGVIRAKFLPTSSGIDAQALSDAVQRLIPAADVARAPPPS